MNTKILVGYATRYGSTEEVAGAVAETLRGAGFEVDLLPVKEVRNTAGYQAVVLGAPLFIGSWHKEARRFLEQNSASLSALPVAVFALGPVSADEKEMQGSREQFDLQLAKYPWLKPVAKEVFIGKFDPAKLRFPDSLLNALPASPLHNMPATDLRDWKAIRAWASKVGAQFQAVAV